MTLGRIGLILGECHVKCHVFASSRASPPSGRPLSIHRPQDLRGCVNTAAYVEPVPNRPSPGRPRNPSTKFRPHASRSVGTNEAAASHRPFPPPEGADFGGSRGWLYVFGFPSRGTPLAFHWMIGSKGAASEQVGDLPSRLVIFCRPKLQTEFLKTPLDTRCGSATIKPNLQNQNSGAVWPDPLLAGSRSDRDQEVCTVARPVAKELTEREARSCTSSGAVAPRRSPRSATSWPAPAATWTTPPSPPWSASSRTTASRSRPPTSGRSNTARPLV